MIASRSFAFGFFACTTLVLGACVSSGAPHDPGRSRTGRTDAPQLPHARGVKACPAPKAAADGSKSNQYDREWQRIEAEYEQPLRDVVNANTSAEYALATLDKEVLKPRKWSLSSYLIRVIRELQSGSVREAGVEIGHETYAEAALRDAFWDGNNAWDIVQGVRGQTLDIFVGLEKARTTDNPKAHDAQVVADGLINAARTAEPWVFAGCVPPKNLPPEHDPLNAAPVHSTAAE